MASALSLKDFEEDMFVLEKYVEKIAQLDPRTGLGPLGKSGVKPFDAKVLLSCFENSIASLKELADKNERRVEKLEKVCQRQEREHSARIKDLENTHQIAFEEFHKLEERITYVATKVVHLGDQLEATNSRRDRAVEAQELIRYLAEFEENPKPNLPIFNDSSMRLEAADLIFKLNNLAWELPTDKKYHTVRRNITEMYAQIEAQLVDDFVEAQRFRDMRRMKEYAHALQPFNYGYTKVVENFIHLNLPPSPTAQQVHPSSESLFLQVEQYCEKSRAMIATIFDNPEMVMTKYIQVITEKILQKHIDFELGRGLMDQEREKYLQKLHALYMKTLKLQDKLSKFDTSMDVSYMSKHMKVLLFNKYLSSYAQIEAQHMKERCSNILAEFNRTYGIGKKKDTAAGGLLAPGSGHVVADAYVSQDVCASILYESKHTVRRCTVLLSDLELAELARDIFFIILDSLCVNHFLFALDQASSADPKSGLFIQVVFGVNSNMHLLEKQLREIIMPCIHYSMVASKCIDKRRDIMTKLEAKIEAGIEKSIQGMVGHVKSLLASHQKKNDYRPEETVVPQTTQGCSKAVEYINECCSTLRSSLDGKNLEVVLLEFGVRLHRVVYDHIQQYAINDMGAMILICDMNEYRKSVKEFKHPFLDELFENLQALCNIFVVKPENLKQVCSEDPYVNFDRTVLVAMIQLRADYKSARLGKIV